MLFELNNDIDNYEYYFNINKENNRKDIDLNNGYFLGNIFTNEYKKYKDYKQKKINAYSEEQKLKLKIQELDFILNDLNLYLDINPKDTKLLNIFEKYNNELKRLTKIYEEKYEILELNEVKDNYTWINNPWPWDGGYYV